MGKRTGKPKGRPKGAKNLKSEAHRKLVESTAEKLRATIPNMFDGTSHMLLMSIYKDMDQPMPVRLDAAKAAIRYETPALASIESKKNEDQFAEEQKAKYADMDVIEIARRVAFCLAEADRLQAKEQPEQRTH